MEQNRILKDYGKLLITVKKHQYRDDDNDAAIKERLADYHAKTAPIIQHYGDKAVKIDATQELEKIAADTEEAIGF